MKELQREQRIAVRGANGLHGSAVRPNGRRELCWKDLGPQAVSTSKGILMEHQPLAFYIIQQLATPRPKKNEHGVVVVRRTRPTDIVRIPVGKFRR